MLILGKRVETVGEPTFTEVERRWRCVMEVTLKDGRVLPQQTMAAKGSFENPLTSAEESEKALDLIAPVLGKKRGQVLVAALWNFEKLEDVHALRGIYAK